MHVQDAFKIIIVIIKYCIQSWSNSMIYGGNRENLLDQTVAHVSV